MVSGFFLSYGSSATRSSGSSSLTMNSSTQSSFCWYSGSVSKSHTASDATAIPLVKRGRLIWQSMTIHTRPGHKADVSELSHALGRAFYDDPVSVWIMPDPKARAAHLRKFFATVTRHHHLAGGGVEVATDGSTIGAAALSPRPGRRGARTRLSRIQQGRKCAVLPAVRFRGHRRNYPSRSRPDVVAYVAAAALSRSTQPLTQP